MERKLGTIGNQNFNWGNRFAFQKGHSDFWLVTRSEIDKFGRRRVKRLRQWPALIDRFGLAVKERVWGIVAMIKSDSSLCESILLALSLNKWRQQGSEGKSCQRIHG